MNKRLPLFTALLLGTLIATGTLAQSAGTPRGSSDASGYQSGAPKAQGGGVSSGIPTAPANQPPMIDLSQPPTLSPQAPVLQLNETVQAWEFTLTGGPPSRFMLLYFGISGGSETVDLGEYGSVDFSIGLPSFPQIVGPFDSAGGAFFAVSRPLTLPPQVIGIILGVQGICVDYTPYVDSNGATKFYVSLSPTNPLALKVMSQAALTSDSDH